LIVPSQEINEVTKSKKKMLFSVANADFAKLRRQIPVLNCTHQSF
jgi:hypothetical protein